MLLLKHIDLPVIACPYGSAIRPNENIEIAKKFYVW
jgi:hypothetical protein